MTTDTAHTDGPTPVDLDAISAAVDAAERMDREWIDLAKMFANVRAMVAELRELRARTWEDLKQLSTQAGYDLGREDGQAELQEQLRHRDSHIDELQAERDRLAETVARVERMVDEWQTELDEGRIRDEDARYCWNLAATDIRRALDEAQA